MKEIKQIRFSLNNVLCLNTIHNLPIETLGGPPRPKGDHMFELKQYAYLDEKKIYPVIISANLSGHEE